MTDKDHAIVTTAEPQQIQRMHPLVELAMKAGTIDPSTLKELLAVQREWERGEAQKAFTLAKIELMREMPRVIPKDSTVDYQGAKGRVHYTHASLAAAMDAVTPALITHGFALTWTPGIDAKGLVTVACRLTHAAGHFEETTISAPPDGSGGKNAAQAVASTITLLQRYTALALLGIATADMKEPTGEGAEKRVDAERNLKVVARLAKLGKSRANAEAFLEKDLSTWTGEDIEKLRGWVETDTREHSTREPGSDG